MTRPAADVVLGARYRLTDRIAGGGMGEVWAARDEVLGRDVAVKILRKEYADDPTFLERFRAEARHTAALSHAGIAAVYDFGEGARGDESPYLVMERVPGEPLSALVAREGPLPPERTLDIVGQAALALEAAHDIGVIHRDVKPGNILVTPTGSVKITDFGIARATNSVPLTQTGAIMGTAYYISPEQASGSSVTPASDIYSLGIVAYECLTGQRPFRGDTPVSVAMAQVRDQPPALPDTVPEPVRALVMRMLAKDPAERPGSAGAVGRDALRLAAGAGAGADQVGADQVDATRVLPSGLLPGAGAAAYASSGQTTTAVVDDLLAADRGGGTEWRRSPADTDPGFHLPAPAQLPRWVPYAVALAVAAVLLLLLVRACGGATETVGTSAGSPSPEASAPTTVQVVAEDYLGDPVGEARAELAGLGLRVEVVRTPGDGTVGTVKAVAPTGEVAAGSLVTLTAVAASEEESDGEDEGEGDEKDEKDDGPDKGDGKGKGRR